MKFRHRLGNKAKKMYLDYIISLDKKIIDVLNKNNKLITVYGDFIIQNKHFHKLSLEYEENNIYFFHNGIEMFPDAIEIIKIYKNILDGKEL